MIKNRKVNMESVLANLKYELKWQNIPAFLCDAGKKEDLAVYMQQNHITIGQKLLFSLDG